MRLAKQVSSILAVRWVLLALSFVTSIFVARILGPDGKGIVTLITALVNLLAVLATIGLPTAALYLYKKKGYAVGDLVGSSFFLYIILVLAIAVVLFALPTTALNNLVGASGAFEMQPLWLWLSLGTVLCALLAAFGHNILVVDDRMRLYAFLNIGSQLVSVFLMWMLVIVFGFGISGALAAIFGAQLFAALGLVFWLRGMGDKGQLHVSWRVLREMLRSGIGPYVTSLIANIFKRGETILLAFLLSIQFIGYYGVALTVYELMVDLPRSVVLPMVGRLADPNNLRAVETANRNIRLQIAVMFVPVLVMALVAPLIVPLAYGQRFAPAGVFLAGLLPGVLFRTVHLSVSAYFVSIGRMEATVPSVTTAAVVNLGLDLVLVPNLGLTGVAISNVIAEMLMALVSVVVFLRATRGRWEDVFPPRRSDLHLMYHMAGGFLARLSSAVTLRLQ